MAADVAPPRVQKRFKRVTVFRSQQRSEDYLKKVGEGNLRSGGSSSSSNAPAVTVCPDSTVGKAWIGFGGSFTESAAMTLHRMSKEIQDKVLSAYFDPLKGLGYTQGRVHIGSCDFSTGNWTCGDVYENSAGDLQGFSIQRYKEHILPFIRSATKVAGREIDLLASPWSPPPVFKTPPLFNQGQLKEDHRKAYAQHYVRFIQEMRAQGATIWGITVQNEPEAEQPWESCKWSGEAERDFIRDFLGPALEVAGLSDVKILAWDHNRDGMLDRAAVVYGDEKAAKYIWGIAYHWYGDARFEVWADHAIAHFSVPARNINVNEVRSQVCFDNVRRVAQLRPDKHIVQTESCQELGENSLQNELGCWRHAERYAMNILADMASGCESWIDWNLCLDEAGGPNHTSNHCISPVILDTRLDRLFIQPAYHILAHFAKFIRPGAIPVNCGSSRDALDAVAFLGPEPVNALTVVILNQTQRDMDFELKVIEHGKLSSAAICSPSHSILSVVVDAGPAAQVPTTWDNLVRNGSNTDVAERRPYGESDAVLHTRRGMVLANAENRLKAALLPDRQRTWLVVGGSNSGGLIVRKGEGIGSAAFETRLETGSRVEEVALKRNRLQFKKLSGSGPDVGWVSIKNQDRWLMKFDE
mmetsp:Transcript_49743/g.111953  ORF Transcript_49743/g.111953 Transcript_49743/m.111953 type:complete len:641 (+) Transcript_49743:50-1972(+)